MSAFNEAIRGEISQIVAGHLQRNVSELSVPLDLADQLPKDLTARAVRSVIETTFGKHPHHEADRLLSYYPEFSLLRADTVLDKLDFVNTPNDSPGERLEAIKTLIDLNRRNNGTDDFKKGLIGTMHQYWDQIPIFYADLVKTFDTLERMYDEHPKLLNYRNWMTYDFRDGILGATEELATRYGEPFDSRKHENGFGIRYQRERFIFPGVTVEKYLGILCEANIHVADSIAYINHIGNNIIPHAENWRGAIRVARNAIPNIDDGLDVKALF